MYIFVSLVKKNNKLDEPCTIDTKGQRMRERKGH